MDNYTSNISLPNGAKSYICGNKVTQDILRRLVEPDATLMVRDMEESLGSTNKGQILSSLTRLKGYGVISGFKKNDKSRTVWKLNHVYTATVRSIIYGEK